MTFQVTGRQRGNFTILFRQHSSDPGSEDELVPLVAPGEDELVPLDPLVAPGAYAAVDGRVEDPCAFDLFLVASGTRRKGFVERLTSSLTATITPDQNGDFSVETDVVNRVTQLRPIRSICVSSVSAPASDATVEGKLDPTTGTLDMTVSFSDIEASTMYRCPPRVGTGRSDGRADVIPIEPGPIRFSIPNALTAIASWTAAGGFRHTAYADIRIDGVGIYTIIPH